MFLCAIRKAAAKRNDEGYYRHDQPAARRTAGPRHRRTTAVACLIMRLLMLTKYGRLGASSRLRSYAYLPALQAAGWQVTVSPLMSDDYVCGLQLGRRALGSLPSGYARRMIALRSAAAHDLVWIEKDALPWLPFSIEKTLLGSGARYVLDYDDAVFHHYDQHRSSLVRTLLGRKHNELMKRSVMVVAGNDYLAQRARAAGAANVQVVPTVVDIHRYPDVSRRTPRDGQLEVVWIGQRSTGRYLQPLAATMRQLEKAGLCRFTAIGIDAAQFGLPMRSLPWDEQREAAVLSEFDVGLMPLPDTPFERGKCGYKLIQYMACGLPVVASPVGVNVNLVAEGENGFLANTPADWESAIRKLAANPALRSRMGEAGRKRVADGYSLDLMASRLMGLLDAAAKERQGDPNIHG